MSKPWRLPLVLATIAAPILACGSSGGLGDTGFVGDLIGACGDQTLEDIQQANDISDDCRAAIQDLLPGKQTTFDDRLLVLGAEQDGGQLNLYLAGIEGRTSPLDLDAFTGATLVAIDGSGTETPIDDGDWSVGPIDQDGEDVLRVSLVTDYSGSMREEDLDTVAEMYTDLVTHVPNVYQGESIAFSTLITQRQSFTSDTTALANAVDRDDSIERDGTALYDGMGTAVDHLSSSGKPAKLLVVATDGLENSSESWQKTGLVNAIKDDGIVVVMIGAMFADIDEMSDLAGNRGVFFYGKDYSMVKTWVGDLVDSLENAVHVQVDNVPAGTEKIRVQVGGVSGTAKL